MKTRTALFFAGLFFSIQAAAIIRYVTPSGAGAMNGTSWINAFPGTQLQDAIDASAPGDEVWVRAGTYLTSVINDRNEWFSMRNGVAIYGSFAGTETSLSQRSFSCGFTSVLTAEIGAPGNADNGYHVFSNSSLNTTAILDGFTIRDAHANFDLVGNDNRSLGGGMLNNGQNGGLCTPTLRNCLFTNNTALFGGGIFDHGQNGGNASPVIVNCIFIANHATGGGGAIDNFGYNGNASPLITNCIFYGNTATDRAGAMYCWGGGGGNASPVILNSVFVNNSSFDGGAIVCDRLNFSTGSSGVATPVVRNSIFWGNTATGTGPQFIAFGGATFQATYTLIDIANQVPPHTISGAGTGNIFAAPSFLNMANAIGPDNCWLTTDDGLQLQFVSQGIDDGNNAGVTAFDIRGYNRISNGVVDLGPYEFNSIIVPLNFVRLYGIAGERENNIFWKTSQDGNNHFFEVQRSADGINFVKIGEVMANNNNTALQDYQFRDDQLTQSTNYYRVKHRGIDGRSELSPIILLTSKEKNEVRLFPNPVIDKATIVFRTIVYNEEYVLVNGEGKQVDQWIITGNSHTIDLGKYPGGLYLLINKRSGVVTRIIKAADQN